MGLSKRNKRAIVPFSPELASVSAPRRSSGNGGRKGQHERKSGPRRAQGRETNPFAQAKNRILSRLSVIRQLSSMIEAYDMDGWKGASRKKLRPSDEIAKAHVKIFQMKLKVRELFEAIEIDNHRSLIPAMDVAGEVDAEDVFCAACGGGDATDEDDILLCDGFCDRAFHQLCVVPPVTAEKMPPHDEGWLCPLCDARVDCFYAINADFDLELDMASATWQDVFSEEATMNATQTGPGQTNASNGTGGAGQSEGLMHREWTDDDSNDEDFGSDAVSDDGLDDEDEPLSGSGRNSSDSISKSDPCIISGAESIREAVTPEPELILGKRRRAVVDYRKLNAELFGEGEAFEGEDEDEMTGDWGPASPSKDRKLTRLEANWQKRKRVGTTLSAGSLDTSRTSKRRFPDETKARLKGVLQISTHSSKERTNELADDVMLKDAQVKTWF